jgi:hypothetical protein
MVRRQWWMLVAVGLTALGPALWLRGRATPPRPPVSVAVTLAVDTFRAVAPAPTAWRPGDFTQALALRLARVPGLGVTLGGGHRAQADFTLDGEGVLQGGRLVVTSRLYHRGETAPLWNATFWRSDAADSTLAADLASDVAEALYGHLTRRSTTAARP